MMKKLFIVLALTAGIANAQTYPAKPIKMLLGFAPGGPTDVIARVIAQAVLIGRATLYGVCAAGEAGAQRALAILRDEFTRSMQLCGARNVNEIGPDLITRP